MLIVRILLTQECIRGCGHNNVNRKLSQQKVKLRSQLRRLNLGSRSVALFGLNYFSGCPCHVIFVAISHDISLIN